MDNKKGIETVFLNKYEYLKNIVTIKAVKKISNDVLLCIAVDKPS